MSIRSFRTFLETVWDKNPFGRVRRMEKQLSLMNEKVDTLCQLLRNVRDNTQALAARLEDHQLHNAGLHASLMNMVIRNENLVIAISEAIRSPDYVSGQAEPDDRAASERIARTIGEKAE